MNEIRGSVLRRAKVGCGLLLFLPAACKTPPPPKVNAEPTYARVMAMDVRGTTIADYVAEGDIRKTEDGSTFRAVERRLEHPNPMVIRYPLGRLVTVKAPNLLIEPTAKPGWLVHLDRP